MDKGIDFIAIDLETATWSKSSICEIGIAMVKDSKVVETRSWLVKPYRNLYDSFNISIHGITPEMTKDCPPFKEVWREVQPYLEGQVVVTGKGTHFIPVFIPLNHRIQRNVRDFFV